MTTALARNMRTLDPRSGRQRGAQRSGMRKYAANALAGPVRELVTMSYDQPRITYTQVTANHVAVASAISPGQQGAFDCVTDASGNVWTLDAEGLIIQYNSELRRLSSIALPILSSDSLVRRLLLDTAGAVYAGASGSSNERSVVWKYDYTEEGDPRLVWELDLLGSVADMELRAGTLYVAQNHVEGDTFASLSLYGNLFESQPVQIWERATPAPINSVAVNSAGSVFTGHDANTARGETPNSDGVLAPVVDWTPYNLSSDSLSDDGSGSNDRIWWMADATALTGYVDGDEVTELPDYRLSGAEDDSPDDIAYAAADTTDRGLVKATASSGPGAPLATRNGPTFESNALGELSGLRFDGDDQFDPAWPYGPFGQALMSRTDSFSNSNVEASILPNADGVRSFTTFLLVRLDPGADLVTQSRVLLAQSGFTSYELLTNTGTISAPYEVQFGSNQDGIANTSGNAHIGNPGSGLAIIVFHHAGVGVNNSHVRINGVTVTASPSTPFTMTGIESTGPGSRSILGCGYSGSFPQVYEQHYAAGGGQGQNWARGFSGHFFMGLTVLGTGADNATQTTAAEIEQIEGWIAHRAGIAGASGVLPGAHAYDINPPSSTGDAGNLPTFTASQAALRDVRPITAKWSSNHGDLIWAYAAGGQGYAVAVATQDLTYGDPADVTEDVYTYGPKVAGVNEISKLDESSVVYRRIDDQGAQFAVDRAAEANITILATYADGDTVTIGDITLGNQLTFELDAAPVSVTGSNISVDISAAANENDVAQDLKDAIDASALVVRTEIVDNLVKVFPTTLGPTPGAETVTETGGNMTVVDYNAVGFEGTIAHDAWTLDSTETPSFQQPRVSVDSTGAFYVPVSDAAVNRQLVKISENGVLEWAITVPQGVGVLAYACAFPPVDPNYGGGANLGPEFAYLVTNTGDQASGAKIYQTIFKYDLLSRSRAAGGPRETKTFAVAAGYWYEVEPNTATLLLGPATTLLDPDASTVSAAVLDNRIVVVDGLTAAIYDPLAGGGAWRPFTSTSLGEIPKRCKIATAWNGRMVMTRSADDPSKVWMSAQDQLENWDFDPAVPSYQQAVRLSVYDMVTAFIPGESDTATIGCDSSIVRLFGDPAQGGRAVNLSSEIGIAFGTAWATDPEGVLYFFGQLGEIYALGPGESAPVAISDMIRERLRQVDLSAVHIELTWDTAGRGLRVTQKNITPGTPRLGWYWEKDSASWNEDDTLLPGMQATAVTVLDGEDPDDRVMLLGCEDGYVRALTPLAEHDDGSPIEASVLIGPFASPTQAMFWELDVVLASDQGGARYEWFVSDKPDVKGSPVGSGTLQPGRNLVLERATGSYVWLRIFSAGLEAWAFESATVNVSPAGKHRVVS